MPDLPDLPDLPALCAALGEDLVPHAGARVPPTEVTGVHVSELVDPTPFLEGGELLLTTGMPLAGPDAPARAYTARLRRRRVAALGVGLGPVHETLPTWLAAACVAEGLPLFVVPPDTPFLVVARTYWGLLARTGGEQQVSAALGAHRALVRAAVGPDPIRAVVHALAGGVQGWAALLSRQGTVDAVWPEVRRTAAEQAAVEVSRLRMVGARSSATFPVGDDDVVLHPLAARDRATGFVATGCRRPMRHADRQTVLTASALLALLTEQQHLTRAGPRSLRAGAVRLLLAGEVGGARLLLTESGLPGPTARVHLLALDLGQPCDETVVDTLEHLLGGPLVLPRPTGALAVLAQAPDPDPVRDWLAEVAPAGRAIISASIELAQVPRIDPALREALARTPPGTVRAAPTGREAPVDLEPLLSYRRSDLTGAVTAYLRARGRWEDAARDLGVHRNTLRHRIGTAASVLEQDLDDPDVAARLWLTLRDAGLA